MEEFVQQCSDFDRQTAHVGDYVQYNLGTPSRTAWPRCTCLANIYGRNGWTEFMGHRVPEFCKHIKQALKERCIWREDIGIPQTDHERANQICPVCGRSTRNVIKTDLSRATL